MFPYWVIYAIWVAGSVQYSRREFNRESRLFFVTAVLFTVLFVGLRYKVGGDWGAYEEIYENIYFQPLIPALGFSDPGYAVLNWISARLDTGIWLVNLVCSILFMAGVGRLATRQPAPWLAIVVAIPYLIIVVAMGYTRQAAAIGLICFGLSDASERSLGKTVFYVAVATLFHKTAVLLLPVMIAPIATRKPLYGLIGCVLFVGLFAVFLRGKSDQLVANYVQSDYDSQGAAIRVAMNVLAASIFLILRKDMDFTSYQRSVWTYISLLALVSVPALVTFSASSGVDRLSLFLIPMQLVSLSRLPSTIGKTSSAYAFLIFIIITYSFTIQFIWLNYATNATSWLPYKSVILP